MNLKIKVLPAAIAAALAAASYQLTPNKPPQL
jgi:hypothetical protein